MLISLLRYVAGLAMAGIAIWVFGKYGIGGLIAGLPLMVGGAICLYPLITEVVGNAFADFFYSRSAGELPEQFTQAKALLSAGENEAAVAVLQQMLVERPGLATGRALLVRVWYERLGRADEALALADETLARLPWHDDYTGIAMIAADICLERDNVPAAAERLRQAIGKATSKADRAALTQRLHAIQPPTTT